MRLVDEDEIKKRERDVVLANGAKHRCFDTTLLVEIPTIDAVDVVRCKDCRYYDAENHNCLDELGYARVWEEDDYCSFAERRKDGKTD